jgi:hypothetical protein
MNSKKNVLSFHSVEKKCCYFFLTSHYEAWIFNMLFFFFFNNFLQMAIDMSSRHLLNASIALTLFFMSVRAFF